MRDYEEIRNFTDPLSLKKLNDQLRLLWFKTKSITGKDIRFDTISADQIVVGENASLGSEVQSIIDGKVEPSGVVSIINGTVTADYIEALQVVARRLTTLSGPTILADVYKDAYGGKLKINNNSGNLVAAMGVESGSGDNRNGTLVLYDGGISKSRVEVGISKDYGAGLINLRNGTGEASAMLYARGSWGYPMMWLSDSNGARVTYLTTVSGSINGENIATQNWVINNLPVPNRIATQTDVGSSGASIDGSSGTLRLRSYGGNTTVSCQTDGNIVFYYGGTAKHSFRSDGTKMGGSIEIDGVSWGLSPIDSPRIMISDLIQNITAKPEGTLVVLDEKLSKAINGYSVFHSGCNIEITEKTSSSFIVKGDGVVDLLILGMRTGSESIYWEKMPVAEPEEKPMSTMGADQIITPQTQESELKIENIQLTGEIIKEDNKNG